MFRTLMVAALALACVASSAEARPKHRAKPVQVECFIFCPPVETGRASPPRRDKAAANRVERRGGTVLVHPRGCPRRLFCGCGAAVHLFGKPIRSLWLARNWFKFPRTNPAPKMVAVRRHHVFVLEEHISGNVWRVYDANSGGGKTRLHVRSIRGYAIVNPHGSIASRGQAL